VRRAALAVVAALAAWGQGAARAQECGRPDLRDAVPPDMAQGVPPNAALTAHYEPSAEYLGEDVILTPEGLGDEVVKATWDQSQGLLTFAPPQPLAPGSYTLRWPSLRGLSTAAPGRGATVRFTVRDAPDEADPVFDGLTGASWDLERRENDCTDALENRMVFDLALGPAEDDGGRDGLTVVVFQTAGGSTDGGSVPVLSAALPPAGKALQVKLPVGEATGHVCFAAFVRDLTGKTSAGGAASVCVETTAPPFFRGCAVAMPGPRAGVAAAVALVGLALLARRRRRRP
jgi:MYXO-CTERM domain-containing protein